MPLHFKELMQGHSANGIKSYK